MRSQGNSNDLLVLLRGPLLVAAVVISVLISVAQSLSWVSIAQLSLLFLGCAVACYDSASIGHDRFRQFLNTQLEGIVWDDVMYKFFHPDITWYSYFTETFLGQAAWVYLFPSTPAQRRHLLQATLNIHDEDQAQQILFAPGGYKTMLLPESFLQWLDGDKKRQTALGGSVKREGKYANIIVENTCDGDAVSSSSSVSGQTTEKESILDFEASVEVNHHNKSSLTTEKLNKEKGGKKIVDGNAQHSRQPNNAPEEAIPSISDTMQSVIFETVADQFRDLLAYAPDSKQIATLGLAAAVSLATQLRFSKRSRNIALGFLEASSVVGLSAITVGAGSLFLAKSSVAMGGFQVNERNLVSYISAILNWRKGMAGLSSCSNADDSGGKAQLWRKVYYAAAVVLLIGLKRRRHARQLHHVR